MNNDKQLIEKKNQFSLLKNSYNQYEIWFSNSFMGYVSDAENFDMAILAAQEEINSLMAEVV